MTVLAITFVDPSPAFDKKSAEVQYLARVLQECALQLQKAQGTSTSITVKEPSAGGTANTTVATITYTPAASNP